MSNKNIHTYPYIYKSYGISLQIPCKKKEEVIDVAIG